MKSTAVQEHRMPLLIPPRSYRGSCVIKNYFVINSNVRHSSNYYYFVPPVRIGDGEKGIHWSWDTKYFSFGRSSNRGLIYEGDKKTKNMFAFDGAYLFMFDVSLIYNFSIVTRHFSFEIRKWNFSSSNFRTSNWIIIRIFKIIRERSNFCFRNCIISSTITFIVQHTVRYPAWNILRGRLTAFDKKRSKQVRGNATRSARRGSLNNRFARFQSFFSSLWTPPNFSLCHASPSPSLSLLPRSHTWRDGERWNEHACARHRLFFLSLLFHRTPLHRPVARRGVVWWLRVRVCEVRVLPRATLTSSMSDVR